MKAYDYLAPYYDKFMEFIDFDAEAKAVHRFLCEVQAREVLDLGAGSGRHLLPLLRNGHKVEALDVSAPMLAVLATKLRNLGLQTQLHEGDMCHFQSLKTYDTLYALGDTIHHLSSYESLGHFLKNSANNLKKGGYLIFTWRDPDYFQELIESGSFYEEHGEDYLLWSAKAVGDEEIAISYTAFIHDEEVKFTKICEEHRLTCFQRCEIKATLKEAGFSIRDDLAQKYFVCNDDADFRIVTVAQKRKDKGA